MAEKPYKHRRTFFIKRRLQTRYIFIFVLSVCIGLNLGVTMTLLSPLVQTMVPALLVIYFCVALLFIGLVALGSVLFTHKVAGPIYRFEKVIKSITQEGDLDQRIFLRQGDELHELADDFNLFLDRLRDELLFDRRSVKQAIAYLDDAIDKAGDSPAKQSLFAAREQLQNIGRVFKVN